MINKSLSQMNKERKERKAPGTIYADCESKRRARLKWRKSRKGQWWDYLYSQRPEVKAKRHEQYIRRKIDGKI